VTHYVGLGEGMPSKEWTGGSKDFTVKRNLDGHIAPHNYIKDEPSGDPQYYDPSNPHDPQDPFEGRW
jgi:hypothetical protein